MGFRNPITSLRADQITAGTLGPGVIVPAPQVGAGTLDSLVIAQALAAGTVTAQAIAAGAVTDAALSQTVAQAISDAQSTATGAQSTADGKNTVTYATSAPTGPHRVDDLWFNTGDGYALSRWNGTTWVTTPLGSDAIATLDAGKITTGTLSADRIGASSIGATKLAADSVTATQIAAGAVGATELAAGSVVAGKIAAGAIDGTTITGTTLQTAASGQRVLVTKAGGTTGAVQFFGGFTAESPAQITAKNIGGASPAQLLSISGDNSVAGHAPEIDLYTDDAPGGGKRTNVVLTADHLVLSGAVDQPSLSDPIISGYRFRFGSIYVATDANGYSQMIAYTSPFPKATSGLVAFNADANVAPDVMGVQGNPSAYTKSTFQLRVMHYNNTPLANAHITVGYLAWGY